MLIIRQECITVGHFQEFTVPSRSHEGKAYKVLIHPNNVEGSFCECEGYFYRHACAHIDKVQLYRCDWVEGEDPDQTMNEQIERICPRCSGNTILVVVDE